VKAKDLVWMVEELKASVWRSSLLWREVEIVLEKIVDHAVLFSDLYWAVYFIIAEFTPQSVKSVIRVGAIMAIATMPYSDGERSLATIMPPIADMSVEMVEPQKRLNPPLTETLAILIALVTETLSPTRVFS